MEMWSRERNYGLGSSAGGGKYGPGREIMVLGQALVAGSVVQGEKPCPWVKPVPARVWSEERNYGLGSSADGGKYGPGSQTAGLGQAPPRPSVVRGEKLWSWVKRWWREVWSRERNCGFGSSAAPSECGPRREIMVFGQTLVAGSVVQGAKPCPWVKPRRSMVQGAKLRPWVKPRPARVWSEERNYGLGSSAGGGKCGPGSQTAALGQARPRQSMVQGAKLRPRVTPVPAVVWSREQNRAHGSTPSPPKCGPGSQTAARVKPDPAKVWSREQNRAPGSSPAPP